MVNGSPCTIEFKLHGGEYSTTAYCDSYASFLFSNLPRASITQ